MEKTRMERRRSGPRWLNRATVAVVLASTAWGQDGRTLELRRIETCRQDNGLELVRLHVSPVMENLTPNALIVPMVWSVVEESIRINDRPPNRVRRNRSPLDLLAEEHWSTPKPEAPLFAVVTPGGRFRWIDHLVVFVLNRVAVPLKDWNTVSVGVTFNMGPTEPEGKRRAASRWRGVGILRSGDTTFASGRLERPVVTDVGQCTGIPSVDALKPQDK